MEPETRNPKLETRGWTSADVRRLRRWLKLSQRRLAEQLGVRHQTISEWETGAYRPRGASARLLDIVAERAGLAYEVSGSEFRVSSSSQQEEHPGALEGQAPKLDQA